MFGCLKKYKRLSFTLCGILCLSACGKNERSSENLSPYERWLRFTHFSDPSWTYQAARNYVFDTDFSSQDLNILSREEWGARPPKAQLNDIGFIDGIVIHHSLTSDRVTPKSIQNFHMDDRGWDDVGYHFLIARDQNLQWQLFEGRRLPALGAHAGRGFGGANLNTGKIGIVMVGNFGKKGSRNPEGWPPSAPEHQRQPEQEVVRILGTLIHQLLDEYPSIDSIFTHRTDPYNINPEGGICPGKGALPIFESFMESYNLENEIQFYHSFF